MIEFSGRELTTEEIKEEALKILIDVADFCDNHNIRYFLACGTLLGAIRHKGYIPWDDDIDINMPRPDYMRFIELFGKEQTKYGLITPYDGNPQYYFSKVYDKRTVKFEKDVDYTERKPIGIDIDVFPIDGQPNDFNEHKKRCKQRARLGLLLYMANCKFKLNSPKNIAKFALMVVGKAIGKENLMKKYIKNATKYDYETSELVGVSEKRGRRFEGGRYKREVFENRIKVPFENYEFWSPEDYDTYLTVEFGDYMTPPPAKEQATHHGIKCYYLK